VNEHKRETSTWNIYRRECVWWLFSIWKEAESMNVVLLCSSIQVHKFWLNLLHECSMMLSRSIQF
jgi:hypothetical protein